MNLKQKLKTIMRLEDKIIVKTCSMKPKSLKQMSIYQI